ncbi:YhgE/Pip-like protein [Paenibacillus sp. DS2015]|uniref:YhgE/Pip family protein n=1 Tax=Paenibacillus sp. DS2015 TaxID=3373917 RepID=UPI003D25355E
MGLQVDHIGQFILISIISSVAFMFLVMLLTVALGNPGRFLAMILLVIQLGASGGMFPMELNNGFFNAIHPYLPMTFAVAGQRQAIASGMGNGVFGTSILILIGFIVLFNLLLILTMSVRTRKDHNISTENEAIAL